MSHLDFKDLNEHGLFEGDVTYYDLDEDGVNGSAPKSPVDIREVVERGSAYLNGVFHVFWCPQAEQYVLQLCYESNEGGQSEQDYVFRVKVGCVGKDAREALKAAMARFEETENMRIAQFFTCARASRILDERRGGYGGDCMAA